MRNARGDYQKRDDTRRLVAAGSTGDVRMIEGLLTTDLEAPESFTSAPQIATGQPHVPDDSDVMQPHGDPVDLVNYHPSLEGGIGDYFLAVWRYGAWHVIDVQCP